MQGESILSVTEAAQVYFRHLIKQQEAEGLAILMGASQPGTPAADCELAFCEPGEQGQDAPVIRLQGFDLYLKPDSVSFLQDAVVDFDEDSTGGRLTIRAPYLRGNEPGENAALSERVAWLLQAEINPALANHGGFVSLVKMTDEGIAVLQFGGGCHGCGMVNVTLKEGIEKTLLERIPEVKGVQDMTEHEKGENPYY